MDETFFAIKRRKATKADESTQEFAVPPEIPAIDKFVASENNRAGGFLAIDSRGCDTNPNGHPKGQMKPGQL